RSEVIRLDRADGCAPVRSPRADSGVVHEDVELGSEAREILCERSDAAAVGDVQLMIEDVFAFGVQLTSRCGSFILIATRQDDAESVRLQLDASLKTQAPIGAGHERRRMGRGGRGSRSHSLVHKSAEAFVILRHLAVPPVTVCHGGNGAFTQVGGFALETSSGDFGPPRSPFIASVSCRRRREISTAIATTPAARATSAPKKTKAKMNSVGRNT